MNSSLFYFLYSVLLEFSSFFFYINGYNNLLANDSLILKKLNILGVSPY